MGHVPGGVHLAKPSGMDIVSERLDFIDEVCSVATMNDLPPKARSEFLMIRRAVTAARRALEDGLEGCLCPASKTSGGGEREA